MAGMKYIGNCSLGKDSLAMILLLVEKRYPLDEVIFYDTEMEFQAVYNNLQKLKNFLAHHNIKLTEVKNKLSFEYQAFYKTIHKKNGEVVKGYDWCGGCRRWATSNKVSAICKYYKTAYKNETIIEYIGIAADEKNRVEKARAKRSQSVKIYPLLEWGMTENDCLEYCFSHGWDWKEGEFELYHLLDRVSCWCCANKNQKEIKNIIQYLPKYWNRIKEYEKKCRVPYKGKGCQYFEDKFQKSQEQITIFDYNYNL